MIILKFPHKEAQTFAIRRTVHHKPHRNTGNLRPIRGSSYILCSLVASTVVIVRLSSFMSLRSYRIASAKITNNFEIMTKMKKKNEISVFAAIQVGINEEPTML